MNELLTRMFKVILNIHRSRNGSSIEISFDTRTIIKILKFYASFLHSTSKQV